MARRRSAVFCHRDPAGFRPRRRRAGAVLVSGEVFTSEADFGRGARSLPGPYTGFVARIDATSGATTWDKTIGDANVSVYSPTARFDPWEQVLITGGMAVPYNKTGPLVFDGLASQQLGRMMACLC